MRDLVSGEATWLTSGRGSVAAWVHRPEGPAVGTVVLAPPVDREHVISYRAWHLFARELAHSGFVAVRFSFRGDGDSDPLAGDDPVACWTQDLRAAVDLASSLLPGVPVSVVGLRIGATVAANTQHEQVGARVLWEPVSGRAYVRGQRALRQMGVEQPVVDPSEGSELAGAFYSPEATASIGRLKAPPRERPEVRVEPDREAAAKLYAVTTRDAEVPWEALTQIIAALPRVEPRQPAGFTATTVAHKVVDGTPIVEQLVEVGPDRLTGILSAPAGDALGVSVAFSAAGAEPKDGPTGLWAQAARRLAARGVMVLRAERRGTGDDLDPAEPREPNPYRDSAVHDTAEMARFLRRHGATSVVGVGVSAGGWLLARASSLARFDGIVMVNNVGWHPEEKSYRNLFRPTPAQLLFGQRVPTGDEHEVPAPTKSALSRLRPLVRRLRDAVVLSVPTPLWALGARFGLTSYPLLLLQRVPRHTRTWIFLGDKDAAHWRRTRGPQSLARLLAEGRDVQVQVEPRIDHSLLARAAREVVVEELCTRIPRFGTARPGE